MPITKALRVALGFGKRSDPDLQMFGRNVLYHMRDSLFFRDPPVSYADFESVLDKHRDAMVATIDGGSKKAFAEKNYWRGEVIVMLRQLGHYVEDVCKGDPANMAIFVTSGFDSLPNKFKPAQPLDPPRILKTEQGPTGVLLIYVTPLGREAKHYQFGWARVDGSDTPEAWTIIDLASARAPVKLDNLTPGVTYAFRVRAYGQLGHTDWSSVVTRMCI